MSYFANLFSALDFTSIGELLVRLVSVLLCLTIHESCHGLAASALGDPTAKAEQRLSLNPLHHIDWFGLLAMVLLGFGWAKPVPVDLRYFRNPKQGMALTALAGPVSNFLLAFLLLLLFRLTSDTAPQWLLWFFVDTAILSVGLGLFNMIPVPPLDGSKVLFALLPDRLYAWVLRYENIGMLVLFALLFTGVGDGFLSQAIYWVFLFLANIVGI